MTIQEQAIKAWEVLLSHAATGFPEVDDYNSVVYKDVTAFMWDWWPSYMPWNPAAMAEAIQYLIDTRPIEEFGMIKVALGLDMMNEFKLALAEEF